MANQGIIHIASSRGGRPWCNTRRSHMSTTVEALAGWPRVCIKCQRVWDNMKARAAAKAARCENDDAEYHREQARAAELMKRGAANW